LARSCPISAALLMSTKSQRPFKKTSTVLAALGQRSESSTSRLRVLVCHRRSPFLTHGAWRSD
jgi:hypothetical protein